MTKEKIATANRLLEEIDSLKDAELKLPEPEMAKFTLYYNLRSEFIDLEDYNSRVRLKRKQLEETLAAL